MRAEGEVNADFVSVCKTEQRKKYTDCKQINFQKN